jgi:hypothetical protein
MRAEHLTLWWAFVAGTTSPTLVLPDPKPARTNPKSRKRIVRSAMRRV